MITKHVKKLCSLAVIGLALCLVQNASAQNPVPGTENDYHWIDLGGNQLWDNANNWEIWTNLGNVNPSDMVDSGFQGLPLPGNPTTPFVSNVWLDPAPANGDSVITIPVGDTETPGIGNSTEEYNTIFGPEFGATLNIYGTLEFDWTIAPYQPDPSPGNRSHINMYGNAYMYTTGASLNLGSGWWPVCEGTYVTLNMYNNANYSSLGGAGLWSGGHINIYDDATFLANGYVNFDNGEANNDGTTDFVLGGGTLILPEGFSGNVTNWISRDIVRAYGKGLDTNDLIITDNGTNTYVTAVPLGGALQRVYLEPLNRPNVTVGTFQQITLVGDYPSVGAVLLSSSEPGLDPTNFTAPVYESSNPNVATIDTNGLVTAVGIGTATFTATVGAFTSTNSVSLTVSPLLPNLIHRYSFTNEANDSVGSANGTLTGDATVSGGYLVLDGTQGSSVTLPAGILSGLDEVTIEAWATFPSAISPYANLFAFGNQDITPDGENYITFSPHTGAPIPTFQANFGQGDPGFNGERDSITDGVLDDSTNMQIVVVFHPLAGYEAVYTNGVLASSTSMFNTLIDPVANAGPTYVNVNTSLPGASILEYTLGTDPVNFIGESLYGGDPGLLANIKEFRIYSTALTPVQIAADNALGPNQLIGTSTHVSVSASVSGGNLIITWPTSSELVNLVSTSSLGVGASWTTVSQKPTVVGGNYQVTIPVTGSAQYFGLSY
jgi:Bacterial Ig-like domain (group 2)